MQQSLTNGGMNAAIFAHAARWRELVSYYRKVHKHKLHINFVEMN